MSTQIATPLPMAYLEAVQNRGRKPRKKSLLTTEEKGVIDKYRDVYRNMTKTEDRCNILRNNILVDIFNFWFQGGVISTEISPEDLSERIKV
jgi:hypothetical protein